MKLVVVESPTKARTIGKFLGKDYEIKASMGHILDLPKSKLAVDVEHNFAPLYELVLDKKKIIDGLKESASKAEAVILATDPDREGEAIASHVAEVLNSSSKFKVPASQRGEQNLKLQRIVFHEITKEAIEEALQNPRGIDKNLVDAQTARRVLDRLVGYKLSPLLWQKVRRGLSAGRVQSVALRLIVEREREIEKFIKSNYFTIHAFLVQKTQNTQKFGPSDNQAVRQSGSPSFPSVPNKNGTEFELTEINEEKIDKQESFDLYDGQYKITKTSIDSKKKAQDIVEDLKTNQFVVADVLQKEVRRSPQPPFTTSTLQQEAARRFGFSGRRTMSLAQKLYEEGWITYHRTDSLNLSSSAVFSMRNYIQKEYGEKYLPPKPRFYKTRQKLAQEAHESIRPTQADGIQNSKFSPRRGEAGKIQSELGRDYARLYELIWRRAIACQMADAIIESTTVVVDSKIKNEKLKMKNDEEKNVYRLKTTGSVLVFDGFLKVNPQALLERKLPNFSALETLDLISVSEIQHETLPPPRYNDASLIKTLEEKGIGRPSTYATIVSTIEGRNYIERIEGRFAPTPVGVAVNDFLVRNFSTIDDIPFTAMMEEGLDEIAKGEKEWRPMIRDFYTPFEKKLEEVKTADRVKIEVEKTDEKCPQCGALLVVRIGRFGKFLSCSTFPKCKFTKAFVEETNFKCPKDGAQIIVKKTRRGRRFYGCSNYPACDFAAWKLEEIKKSLPKQPEE